MADLLLGLDLGTTRVKAGLVSPEGDVVGLSALPTPWISTSEGPVLDVVEFGDLVLTLAADCAGSADGNVVGVGITGMGETGALLDQDRSAIAPGFAWHHTLGDAERVQSALGHDTFMSVTGHGCDLSPSIIKLDYLRRGGHTFREGQRWFNLPEYVAWRLTGQEACELSLSGRTGMFDLTGRCWWTEAFDFLGAGTWLMPGDPVPAGTSVGTVTKDVRGLQGAHVSVAGHDHPVAAWSISPPQPGVLSYSLGTSEAQLRIVAPTLERHEVLEVVSRGVTVDWHPAGECWSILGTLPTGLTLERLATLLGCRNVEERLDLSRQAMEADPPVGAHLTDVGLDEFTISGITSGDTRESLWRQAVADLLVTSQAFRDEVSSVVGRPTQEIMFGGWTHDPLIARERVRHGQRFHPHAPLEPGIVGAAMAAARASGLRESLAAPQPSAPVPAAGEPTGPDTKE